MLDRFFKGLNKKEAISWSFYDFANSSYSLLIMSFIFPIYFREVIAAGGFADFFWGLSVSISILIGGLAAPIIGSMADYDTKRKKKFIYTLYCTVFGD